MIADQGIMLAGAAGAVGHLGQTAACWGCGLCTAQELGTREEAEASETVREFSLAGLVHRSLDWGAQALFRRWTQEEGAGTVVVGALF